MMITMDKLGNLSSSIDLVYVAFVSVAAMAAAAAVAADADATAMAADAPNPNVKKSFDKGQSHS